ncbi:uncharacterized protein LY89DRAFT_676928 [Mollisia scopiformis]|uniref:GAF domain-containing protein n=1 Tax=Mollisia scopiformis TaxID=149040 RepID=A0A132B7Z3_MOLSC|nr:uncharacterized protein LY89DRAFT_676928 [Mollisia scopiformis]KUJ08522.1 hypothetical protein LY89DRAFT_676928 [Mollisia scopiformis]
MECPSPFLVNTSTMESTNDQTPRVRNVLKKSRQSDEGQIPRKKLSLLNLFSRSRSGSECPSPTEVSPPGGLPSPSLNSSALNSPTISPSFPSPLASPGMASVIEEQDEEGEEDDNDSAWVDDEDEEEAELVDEKQDEEEELTAKQQEEEKRERQRLALESLNTQPASFIRPLQSSLEPRYHRSPLPFPTVKSTDELSPIAIARHRGETNRRLTGDKVEKLTVENKPSSSELTALAHKIALSLPNNQEKPHALRSILSHIGRRSKSFGSSISTRRTPTKVRSRKIDPLKDPKMVLAWPPRFGINLRDFDSILAASKRVDDEHIQVSTGDIYRYPIEKEEEDRAHRTPQIDPSGSEIPLQDHYDARVESLYSEEVFYDEDDAPGARDSLTDYEPKNPSETLDNDSPRRVGVSVDGDIYEVAKKADPGSADCRVWCTYLGSYYQGYYNLNNLPLRPSLNYDFEYLPALAVRREAERVSSTVQIVQFWTKSDGLIGFQGLSKLQELLQTVDVAVSTFNHVNEIKRTIHSNGLVLSARKESMVGHALYGQEILIVLDTCQDWRFKRNPSVPRTPNGPGIGFFAAVPLMISSGHAWGVLSVSSRSCRASFSPSDRNALASMGQSITNTLEHKLTSSQRHARQESALIDDLVPLPLDVCKAPEQTPPSSSDSNANFHPSRFPDNVQLSRDPDNDFGSGGQSASRENVKQIVVRSSYRDSVAHSENKSDATSIHTAPLSSPSKVASSRTLLDHPLAEHVRGKTQEQGVPVVRHQSSMLSISSSLRSRKSTYDQANIGAICKGVQTSLKYDEVFVIEISLEVTGPPEAVLVGGADNTDKAVDLPSVIKALRQDLVIPYSPDPAGLKDGDYPAGNLVFICSGDRVGSSDERSSGTVGVCLRTHKNQQSNGNARSLELTRLAKFQTEVRKALIGNRPRSGPHSPFLANEATEVVLPSNNFRPTYLPIPPPRR